MGNKYDSLVEEINKQEEVKEQKANLDNDIQLLKQAMSDLHDNVQKVEKAAKDGTDMVKSIECSQRQHEHCCFRFLSCSYLSRVNCAKG